MREKGAAKKKAKAEKIAAAQPVGMDPAMFQREVDKLFATVTALLLARFRSRCVLTTSHPCSQMKSGFGELEEATPGFSMTEDGKEVTIQLPDNQLGGQVGHNTLQQAS
jgi:hypothetical protein